MRPRKHHMLSGRCLGTMLRTTATCGTTLTSARKEKHALASRQVHGARRRLMIAMQGGCSPPPALGMGHSGFRRRRPKIMLSQL